MTKKIVYKGTEIKLRKMTYGGTEPTVGMMIDVYGSTVAFHSDQTVHVVICKKATVSVEMDDACPKRAKKYDFILAIRE
jgi:hypothetical protein